jgi:hypothetical protein
VEVFLSAAPTARRYAAPALVGGFEASIEGDEPVMLLAAVPDKDLTETARAYQRALPPRHLGPDDPRVWLEARDTGRRWRDLPWWEARLPGGWG